jgi:DNA-binding CsgD family transcriptional regulator
VIIANPSPADFDLSPREREVLKWAAEGKTAWETAQLLGVSESAVRLYAGNAMQKLRAKTKTQAVAIAVRNEVLN